MQRLFGNTLWQLVERLFSAATNLLALAFVARSLGSAMFGQLAIVQSYPASFAGFNDLGLNSTAVRALSKPDARNEGLLQQLFLLKCCLAVVITVVAGVIATFMGLDPSLTAAVFLSLLILLLTPLDFLALQLQAELRTGPAVIANSVGNAATNALLIVLGLHGASIVVLAGAVLFGAALRYGYLLFASGKSLPGIVRPDLRVWRGIIGDVLPLSGSAILSNLSATISLIVLARFQQSAEVGLFSAATRVQPLLLFPTHALLVSIFPLLARYYAERRDRFVETCYFSQRGLQCLAGAIGCAGILAAPLYVNLVLGAEFSAAIPIMQIVVVQVALFHLTLLYGNVLIATGRQRLSLLVAIVSTLCQVVALAILIPAFGALGLALANLLAAAVTCATEFVLLTRFLGVRPDYHGLVATTGFALIAFWIGGRIGSLAPGHPLAAVGGVVACLAVYSALVLGGGLLRPLPIRLADVFNRTSRQRLGGADVRV
jgi:PST family polysaccharide transporter